MSNEPTQRVRLALELLSDRPQGIGFRDIWSKVCEQVPLSDPEGRLVRGRQTSAETTFRFDTSRAVKAGWLFKDNGHWYITGPGREALSRNKDFESFKKALVYAYRYWDQRRADFELAKMLTQAIPDDAWASDEDIAEQADLDANALVRWLQGERPEGWHRVLDPEGMIPLGTLDDAMRAQWTRSLEADGTVSVLGHADAARRIPAAELRELTSEPFANETEAARRVWLVRGSNVQGQNLVRSLWLERGLCSLAASRLREVAPGASNPQVRAAVERDYAHASVRDKARLTAEYHAFLSRMRPDDIVVTNDGAHVYLGMITGEAGFVVSIGNRANLQRPVRWMNAENPVNFTDLPDEISARVGNPDADVIELTEFLGDVEVLLGVSEPEQAPTAVPFELPDIPEELAEELLLPRDWLQECVDLLRERAQLIFYGPPGTGKTYVARGLANFLAGGKPENVQLVQFHPAYAYEDFVEGFRPVKGPGEGVGFDLSRGPLFRMATAARNRPGDPHVLIIDEINRGNLAKIFGELYFLLEYRGEPANLIYGSDDGSPFTLPRNLLILATMNSADRSIAMLDMAMRRRFWFIEMQPDEPPVNDLLAKWLKRHGQPEDAARLLAALNNQLGNRDFRVGPSYFMSERATSLVGLERIWRAQIMPLLADQNPELSKNELNERFGLAALRSATGLS